jgi:hypothetical protein
MPGSGAPCVRTAGAPPSVSKNVWAQIFPKNNLLRNFNLSNERVLSSISLRTERLHLSSAEHDPIGVAISRVPEGQRLDAMVPGPHR